jgi:preprotein translocase subunit SecY
MERADSKSIFSKDNDLKNRIIFTILVLCVYRLGTYIPLPGFDAQSLQTLMQSKQGKGI